MAEREMVEALHPDAGKAGTRVNKRAYNAYRDALLQLIPQTDDGVPFGDLPDLVIDVLPTDLPEAQKTAWWVTTVKLDLEARGLVERVPKASPQRLRKTAKGAKA